MKLDAQVMHAKTKYTQKWQLVNFFVHAMARTKIASITQF
jgi:hypothetical protein